MNDTMVKARALNSESGFAIIEVVVSAAVLAMDFNQLRRANG